MKSLSKVQPYSVKICLAMPVNNLFITFCFQTENDRQYCNAGYFLEIFSGRVTYYKTADIVGIRNFQVSFHTCWIIICLQFFNFHGTFRTNLRLTQVSENVPDSLLLMVIKLVLCSRVKIFFELHGKNDEEKLVVLKKY